MAAKKRAVRKKKYLKPEAISLEAHTPLAITQAGVCCNGVSEPQGGCGIVCGAPLP